ncbi:MAG: glycoside hydrolase family 172 protein [Tepidisphaeraceae bacterium]|jgi:hypothetical protein
MNRITLLPALVVALCARIQAVQAQGAADLYRITGGVFQSHVEYRNLDIPKGREVALADLKGPGKVTYFYISGVSEMVLKVFWDDETEPSIQTPLKDFFGHDGDYQTPLMQVQHRCYMCYLPMPFSKRARFVLANDSDKDFSASTAWGIDYDRDPKYGEEKSRLHCMWRRSNPVKDGAAPLDRLIPPAQCGGKNNVNTRHTILEAKGRGQYVGNFLRVRTQNADWWGEGVTFFTVDGKIMVHSPGTEDEYGSCWCFGGTFAYPYCGYLVNKPGDNLMYRWYVANPVRFGESLKVEIQDIKDFGPGADDFTSTAFWYQEEPHQPFTLQPFAERTAKSNAARSK